MNSLFLVGIGGAAGSILRFLCQRAVPAQGLPFGTLGVNIAGCLLIGILWGYASRQALPDTGRLLLMSGFCGGFTTFSAFTLEGVTMLTEGRVGAFFLYAAASVGGGFLATFAGYKLAH
ncbi:MAG: protein CrcB [Flaviaesturariibacter sp.]|nr:protein CrcB [Flaviaesturariibacter sp.]